MAPKLARGKVGSRSINAALDAADVLPTYAVASVPGVAANSGKLIYVSNGAAGSPCLAYSNGTSWLRITLGAAVAIA